MSGGPIDDRVQPHNLEAEAAILGAVLLHDDVLAQAAAVVEPAHFYREAHRRVFKAMLALRADGQPIDLVTLLDALKRSGDLDEVGGPAYLAALVDGLPRGVFVDAYARIVRADATRRAVIAEGNRMVAHAYEADLSPGAVIDVARNALLQLDDRPAGVVTASQAVTDYVAALDAEASAVWPTGFADLDHVIGGLRPSTLTIVAGRPGSGKSSLGLEFAKRMALTAGPAVDFTREMSARALAARLVAWDAQVESARLERKTATDEEWARLGHAVGRLDGVPLYLDEEAATLTQVAARCQRQQEAGGLACAVVDYLQLLLPEGRHENREAAVASLSRGLKRIARDLQIAVVGLSQLSRAPEARKDKRPHLSDLRESGALEQDADLALLLYRSDLHATDAIEGEAEVIVAKQRDGPTGVVKLAFIKHLALFRNLELHHEA